MRYYLMLFLGIGFSLDAIAQSSLYQSSKQHTLDHNLELFDKQLFSASLYDNTRLIDQPISSEP